jgi:Cu+-exporting ATPase
MSEKTILQVKGMTCSSCAEGISRHLEKKGLPDVHVSYESGTVEIKDRQTWSEEKLISEINSLGYTASTFEHHHASPSGAFSLTEKLFAVCALLTLPLLLHMLLDAPLLHQPLFQFLLATPVLVIGMNHFGKSAIGSLRAGSPNMDVLIAIGSLSAYLYSVAIWQLHGNHNAPLYFETGATIITLLLLGNIIEQRSLKKTQSSIDELTQLQPLHAFLIEDAMTSNEKTREIPVQSLKVNDLVFIPQGSRIPADGIVYEGTGVVDESSMTGESLPAEKSTDDSVFAGTVLTDGSLKMIVQQSGEESLLSRMIEMVRKASKRKPSIQRFGDRVSAVFVPVVIGLALLTFCIWYFIMDRNAGEAIMSAVAVLVISCPCAMGLATPTAVSVGIGKAARQGILIKGGDTLERLSEIKTVVFDKTGTLTDGKLTISKINYHGDKELIDFLLGTLEQYSTHPVAVAISCHFSAAASIGKIRFKDIKEDKGIGIRATDSDGNTFIAGSFRIAAHLTTDDTHVVYLLKNDTLLATVDLDDSPRAGALETIAALQKEGIRTILLSGDSESRCRKLAGLLNISEVYASKLPTQKTELIREWQKEGKVAMIGDGINDAPSLAEAWIGISMGNGTQVAMQSSDLILLKSQDLRIFLKARKIAAATLKTIRQNLFWALIYNLVAIPFAAFGLLSPMIASLSMAFSDVVVIGNSLRLRFTAIFGER